MIVHDIEVHNVRTRLEHGIHLVTKARKIGRQDGGSY